VKPAGAAMNSAREQARMTVKVHAIHQQRGQRGITLFGLLMWAIVIGFIALLAMRVLPTMNEYFTIQKAINKIASEGLTTVPEIRAAFERTKQIEYSIQSISGSDLDVTKENDKVVIRFAYDKEVEIVSPVFLLIKYQGTAKAK
jgi:hypothetical protein